jgi:hypothetical protein
MATGIGQYGFGFKSWRYAEAGKYFTAMNTTPGTGIISGVTTALVNTTPYILFYNGNTVASGIRCYLDFLFLHCTVIGASESRLEATLQLDTFQGVSRYTSGGSSITPTNTNSDSGNASNVSFKAGALTVAAAGNNKNIANYTLSTAIPLVEDQWAFDFGGSGGFHGGGNVIADSASTGHHRQYAAPPVVVGPGEHFLLNTWGASMGTGVTFAFNMGWVEA